MLIVYSDQGSPGGSIASVHLAIQWASTGREVLLIEADPAGGSLSHHLGIQFTPGMASFVAADLPMLKDNLIDHSQDVLFESLHVMPSPSSPTGARGVVEFFAGRAAELRSIAERDMAVIVDGGRLTSDKVAARLVDEAAGVAVITRGDGSAASLEHVVDLLGGDAASGGPDRFVVTIGDSARGADEWESDFGLTFGGALESDPELASDVSAALGKVNRKSRKWRKSLEAVAERLQPYAQPEPTGREPAPAADPSEPAEPVAPAAERKAESPPQAAAPATPTPSPEPPPAPPAYRAPEPPPWQQPAQPAAYQPPAPPEYQPEHPPWQQPAQPPAYQQPPAPPAYQPPEYQQPEYQQPEYQPPEYQQWPQPPAYQPPEHQPWPQQPAAQPPAYQQPAAPPAYPQPEQPPAYQQPAQPPAYPQPGAQPPAYPQPEQQPPWAQQPAAQPPAYQQPGAQPPPYPQPGAQPPAYPQPEQQPPWAQQPAAEPPAFQQPEQRAAEPEPEELPPLPEIPPGGSFRDWAARMHGSQARHDNSASGGGRR